MADNHHVLLTVHAHPDDESSKGAASVARYHAEGIETVLVCCTGGEEGDILNPAMDNDDVRANLPAVRRTELERARLIIGYDHVELLGYRDSGMAGSAANDHPDAFARVELADAVGKLVAILRRYRPDVVVTYADEQEFYPHPDHLRVHDVTVDAYAACGDPAAFPEAGPPWTPKKLYYSMLAFARLQKLAAAFESEGLEFPFGESWKELPNNDHRITTRLDVAPWATVRGEALRAHATQIDPSSPFWFGLSDATDFEINSEEDFVLAESLVTGTVPETDLFAGLRETAS